MEHSNKSTFAHNHDHPHEHAHEHPHTHTHGCASSDEELPHLTAHNHTHDPSEVKAIVNRLSRAIGHLESVKKMVEDGKDCSEVLIQLAAVKAALNNTGKVILKSHISHCIVDAIQEGDDQVLEDLNNAIDKFMK